MRLHERFCAPPAHIPPTNFWEKHKCSSKCGGDLSSSLCQGYLPTQDGNSSVSSHKSLALCLEEDQCKQACDQTDGCYGIDMNREIPRCYLNSAACAKSVEQALGADCKYDFLVKNHTGHVGVMQKSCEQDTSVRFSLNGPPLKTGSYKVHFNHLNSQYLSS